MSRMKISVGELRRRLLEAMNEAGDDATTDAPAATPPTDDKPSAGETGTSLDAQVDRYLNEYEQEAKSAKQEGRDFRSLIKRLMSEAEGDDVGETPAGKASINDIDVESFANSVVRLIDNFDSLLEVRSTLVRRAENFLDKVYDEDVKKEFSRVMSEQHGIEPGKSPEDVVNDQFPAPPAARAGDGGAGPGAGPGA